MKPHFVALMIVAVAAAGCVGDSGQGSASIYVKDAPTDDFDEIHVVFTKVELHRAGDDNDTSDDNETDDADEGDDEGGAGWITVYENASGQDIDLLAANGNKAAFLGESDLAAGKYTQIRIHATEAYGIQDGERKDFILSNNVLKVPKPFTVEADMETKIVIDYDLDRSIKQQGGGPLSEPTYRMTPVIGKTTATVVEDDESGEDAHEEGEISESA